MYCTECGAQLIDNTKFCIKCGSRIEDMVRKQGERACVVSSKQNCTESSSQWTSAQQHVETVTSVLRVQTDAMRIAEGSLSALLAIAVVFVPVLRVNLLITSGDLTIPSMLMRLSELAGYSSELEDMIPFLVIIATLMAIAVICALVGAAKCFMHKGGAGISPCVFVIVYALILIAGLAYIASQTYNIIDMAPWIWILPILSVACVALNGIRRSSAKR